VLLCVIIYIKGSNLDCNKCVLTFKQTKSGGRTIVPAIEFNVKILDLYNNFTGSNGTYCLVEWIRNSGFIDKSQKTEIGVFENVS